MSATSLGDIYKLRRKELRITQPQLAEMAQVSINTIYKLERGTGNPTLDILIKIGDVLGLVLTLETKKINATS
jgi:transcriptional regulator with XRE-family HTH domain